MRLAKLRYRARQLAFALFPGLRDSHVARARSVLSDRELALFQAMEERDRRHGVRVMGHLRDSHHADRDLLAAALLHDCGKGRVPLRIRIANVVAPGFVRLIAAKSSDAEAKGQRARDAAYRLVNHPRLGAELAEAAGSRPATVRYISGRVADHEHDKIGALRAADDRS